MKAIEILAREHDERDENYNRLLRMLDDVVRGKVAPGRITVDLQARTYSWLSEEEWAAKEREAKASEHLDCSEEFRRVMLERNGVHAAAGPLRVEGGIEGLKKLAEEAEESGG